ncbi:hypothetical protein, partial [Brucella anthropi]|uniref:hypothetical protein n=1 Tax=Brucella anthropi TaxID=529 RepID=UPI001AEF4400
RSSTQERRKGQFLDQSLITKPYLEVAHFSVEKPAHFCAETNSVACSAALKRTPIRLERAPSLIDCRSEHYPRSLLMPGMIAKTIAVTTTGTMTR